MTQSINFRKLIHFKHFSLYHMIDKLNLIWPRDFIINTKNQPKPTSFRADGLKCDYLEIQKPHDGFI